jgi:hypothetical protein
MSMLGSELAGHQVPPSSSSSSLVGKVPMRPNEARYSVSKRREEGEAKKGGKEGHGADTAREREKVKERRDGFIPEVDADDGGDG